MNGTIEVFVDGSIAVNPGGAMGFGFIAYYDEAIERQSSGEEESDANSCNVAEYMALNLAFEWLLKKEFTTRKIIIRSDSLMLVKQMKSGYLWSKHGLYFTQGNKALLLVEGFSDITFQWIPREQNMEADELSRLSIPKYDQRYPKNARQWAKSMKAIRGR